MPGDASKNARPALGLRGVLARVFLVCLVAFCCTASGRVTYPDDEISFRTAESVYSRGEFSIEAMDRRTGERPDRPDGSFGVAPGRDGRTYGFFGYALPVLTAPAVAVGDWLTTHRPQWRHAIRGDLFGFYKRHPRADLRRMAVTLSNVPILALAICTFGLWLSSLGFALRTVAASCLALALCTCTWAYASTYLSEPLSMLMLLAAAWQLRCFHQARERGASGRWALAIGASLVGWSVHAHLLNVIAAPLLFAYAIAPSYRAGRLKSERNTWAIAIALGALGALSLAALNGWRFGSPFESGRYDHYGAWILPLEGLAAYTVAPGRSIFLFAPPVALGLWWGRGVWRELPLEARLALALVLTRAAFMAARSDWHGGWGLGPRYLVPVIPFAMLPFAFAWQQAERGRRRLIFALCAVFGVVSAYMAYHSIFEHMFMLANAHGRAHYYSVSHWSPSASPLVGFWGMDAPLRDRLFGQGPAAALGVARFDALSFGALRMGLVLRDWSLFALMAGTGAVGGLAAVSLAWRLRGEQAQNTAQNDAQGQSPLARGDES